MSLLSVIDGPVVPSDIYKWHYENISASISRLVIARDDIVASRDDKPSDDGNEERYCYFADCGVHKQYLKKIKSWYKTYPDNYITTYASDFPWLLKIVIPQDTFGSYINEFFEGMIVFRAALLKLWMASIGIK